MTLFGICRTLCPVNMNHTFLSPSLLCRRLHYEPRCTEYCKIESRRVAMRCTVLLCIVPCCIVLFCSVLYCIVLCGAEVCCVHMRFVGFR